MKASEKNFGFMREENCIEVPFFQRAYAWDKEQWEQLFKDLKESYKDNKKDHFLGSVIFKQLATNAGEGSKRSLIDGQQRLTTFSLLVKVLYECLDDEDKSDYTEYLFQKPTKNKKPRIEHSKVDREVFAAVLRGDDGINHLYQNEKIFQCYQYFKEQIENEKLDFRDFLDFILESKLWVAINLEANEDEQKIFDSINTAGLRLTATDIIKNAIFAKALKIGADYEKLYKECWEAVFEVKENREFWEIEVEIGRIKRVQSEIFLHAFAVVGQFFNPEKNSLEDLSFLYKGYIENFNNNELENFLKHIKEYAKIYINLPFFKGGALRFDEDMKRLFHIISVINVNTAMPLILFLSHSVKEQTLLNECLQVIENYIMTRYVCGYDTNSYNKKFAAIVRSIDLNNPLGDLKEKLNDIPSRSELEKALGHLYLNNRAPKLILFWIELYRRYLSKDKQDLVELNYDYTLGHLIPQTWQTHWKDIVGDDEKAKNYIYQIGNMTLLKGSLNSTIKNCAWKIKLEGDGSRKNCIKKCADLLITRELLDKNEWNLQSVEGRSARLIEEFFKIWKIE
ncbi:DUF262 domain-containing protein [Campylobacter upsaliensis]